MISKDHGYVSEVPANAIPIKAMGRFNHEAACVDPRTGIVYMTEDRNDSLIYRYIPNQKANLQSGGRLQALVITQQPKFDTRNWHSGSMPLNQEMAVEWIELDHPESPDDDLRLRGFNLGAALFARGGGGGMCKHAPKYGTTKNSVTILSPILSSGTIKPGIRINFPS